SKWIRSAPAASTASTSSPRRAKSADRIDGAISGLSVASTFMVELCGGFWAVGRLFHDRLTGARTRSASPSRALLRLVLHRQLAPRGPRVEHERQRQRRGEDGRERPQRGRIARAVRACGLGQPADRRRAEELTRAEAERQ